MGTRDARPACACAAFYSGSWVFGIGVVSCGDEDMWGGGMGWSIEH